MPKLTPILLKAIKPILSPEKLVFLVYPSEERLSSIQNNSQSPPKKIKQTKAELLEEIKLQNQKKKPIMAVRNAKGEREDSTINSMPKLAQKKQLMQRIPSSSKRVPEVYPLASSYAGIPVKPVKIVNAC